MTFTQNGGHKYADKHDNDPLMVIILSKYHKKVLE